MTTAEMVLPAADRFDLRATVLSYGYYELPPCHWTGGARPRLRRVERIDGAGIYLIEVRPTAGGVVMRATGPDADQIETLAPLAVRTRRVLRLDEPLREFRALCRRDPSLRSVGRLGLGRMLRGSSLFEDAVKTIAWTNTTWAGAVQLTTRLGQLGSPCAADRRLRAFPTAEQIVRAGEDELRDRVRLGYRAEYIGRLAREVTEGLRNLEALDARAAAMPIDELAAQLGDIRGVGPASVGWLLLLLGRYERAAIDRATLRFAADRDGVRPTAAEVEARITSWGPWRGLALWCQQWLASGHPAVAELEQGHALDRARRRARAQRATAAGHE